MRRLLLVAAAAGALASCASKDGPDMLYGNSDLELAVGNSARMGCSCLFVMNMSEAYCKAWVKASPDVARLSVDYQAKRVEASAFISWAATAHYVDDKRGCVLE